nr:prophage tail fiber N-terminal domain-containing protein [Edwardsiella ictaluri]
MGQPIANCEIALKALRTSASVIVHTVAVRSPGETGLYDMTVEPGQYRVTLCVAGYPPEYVGNIQVYKDSPNGTLNHFLGLPQDDDLRPDAIKHFEAMVDKVASQVAEIEKDGHAAAESARAAQASQQAAHSSASASAESATAALSSQNAAKASEQAAASDARSAQASQQAAHTLSIGIRGERHGSTVQSECSESVGAGSSCLCGNGSNGCSSKSGTGHRGYPEGGCAIRCGSCSLQRR